MRQATTVAATEFPILTQCGGTNLPPLPAVVSRLVELLDGSRSLADACAEAGLPLAKGQAAVEKLSRLGILAAVLATRSMTKMSERQTRRAVHAGFSPQEEAFFASEVDPIDLCDEPVVTLGERFDMWLSEVMFKLRGTPAF